MRRAFHIWLAIGLGILLVAQAAFTGLPSSEVAGTMTWAMLLIGLPSSVIAYPLATAAVASFEAQGLFPYNSRLLLTLWWAVFFVAGVAQWRIAMWFVGRRKSDRAVGRAGAP